MGTANFYTINAAAVYAVTDNGMDCFRLQTTGARRGWSCIQSWDNDRSRPGLAVLEKYFQAGGGIDVRAQIIRRSGYYSGACLDWEIKVEGYSLTWDCHGDLDELVAAVVDDVIIPEREYYDGWNKGLCAIHRPRLIRELSAAVERAGREADALCACGCDIKLRCLGVFSNGEAFYCRA